MPVAENSPRTLIRWAEKELLNLLTGRYRSTADDTIFEKSRFLVGNPDIAKQFYEGDAEHDMYIGEVVDIIK